MLSGMMKAISRILTVLLTCAYLLAGAPAHATGMGFTVKSLQTEDSGGC